MSQLAKLVASFSFLFREGFPIICDVVVEDESITACTSAAEKKFASLVVPIVSLSFYYPIHHLQWSCVIEDDFSFKNVLSFFPA